MTKVAVAAAGTWRTEARPGRRPPAQVPLHSAFSVHRSSFIVPIFRSLATEISRRAYRQRSIAPIITLSAPLVKFLFCFRRDPLRGAQPPHSGGAACPRERFEPVPARYEALPEGSELVRRGSEGILEAFWGLALRNKRNAGFRALPGAVPDNAGHFRGQCRPRRTPARLDGVRRQRCGQLLQMPPDPRAGTASPAGACDARACNRQPTQTAAMTKVR